MNDNVLVANPNRLHCVIDALCFLLAEALGALCFFWLRTEQCVSLADKIGQTVLVCAFVLLSAFMLPGIVFSVRSLYPRAILTVTDDRVILEKKKEILISDIVSVESAGGRKLTVRAENGDVISLRKSDVNIPLETLEYAIKLRAERIEKNESSEKNS